MDTGVVREWRVRNGPLLTVLAVGVGVGLCCLGLALSGHWAIVRALVGTKVGMQELWTGVLTTAAGGMLLAAAVLYPPAGQMREVGS